MRGVDYGVLNSLLARRRRVHPIAGDLVKNALAKPGLIGQARRIQYALQRFG